MTTVNWQPVKDYSEIIFERAGKIAKITMNRPEIETCNRNSDNLNRK